MGSREFCAQGNAQGRGGRDFAEKIMSTRRVAQFDEERTLQKCQ